ncbi:hypothetical protein [Streptomyces lasiicapitis]|uniref:hypothetical protein n=1 Tax=Streptomyces lasiicapitis TaxID=1923961 RepID=UPI0036654B77
MTNTTTRPPGFRVSRGVKLGWLTALLLVAGTIVVTMFAYSGHSRVTRLYESGVTVEGKAIKVTTDGQGRVTAITVRYRPKGKPPVTTELPTTPKLPHAVQGRSIEVVYNSDDTSDVLSTPQLHAVQPDWNPLSVLGFGMMGASVVTWVKAARQPRSR